jgi:High potential iron-sulfur protein
MVDPADAAAVALSYVADAKTTKNAKHVAGSACGNCALFGGKAGDASGPCPLFAGKQVAAIGWCTAYAKKP